MFRSGGSEVGLCGPVWKFLRWCCERGEEMDKGKHWRTDGQIKAIDGGLGRVLRCIGGRGGRHNDKICV